MDITVNDEITIVEEKLYERPDASDFDKETKHVYRITYQPEAFKTAFADILSDDVKYPTVKAKAEAITARAPFWAAHLNKVLTPSASTAIAETTK